MNTKLKFAFEKETKGAVRYQEVGDDGAPAFAPANSDAFRPGIPI